MVVGWCGEPSFGGGVMGDSTVIFISHDEVLWPHERLYFVPEGKAVGEVLLAACATVRP